MATISIRTDDAKKYSFEGFCDSLGISVSSAINMFITACLRENRIPFELKTDPFWSEETLADLRKSIKQIEEGKSVRHDLIEVEE